MSASLLLSLPVVMFRHAGQCFAFEAQYVSRQGRVDGLEHLPLINYADLLTPNQHAASTVAHWLELHCSSTRRLRLGLQVPAELIELPADCIYALPALLQARRQFSALQALAVYKNELIALLDVKALQQMADSHGLESRSSN